MRTFYRLLNYEFGELLRGVFILCVGLLVSTWFIVRMELKAYGSFATGYERFEDIYSSSGMPIVFLIFIVAMLGLFAKSIYAGYWGSKSIYTFLTLPVKRELLYFSKLCAFLISMLLLLGSQLIGFVLAHSYMVDKMTRLDEGQYVMTNGLFLAFIRSDFMRLLWPYGLVNVLSTVSILLVIVTGVYYAVLCERSKRRWPIVTLYYPVIWAVINSVVIRLDPIYRYNGVKVTIASIILLVISAAFIWHSIYLMKKGAIA